MLVAVTTTDRGSDPNDRADRTTAAGPPAGHRATDAAAHFGAKLRFETDPSDVAAARAAAAGPVLVDVRDAASWDQGHVPGGRTRRPVDDLTAPLAPARTAPPVGD